MQHRPSAPALAARLHRVRTAARAAVLGFAITVSVADLHAATFEIQAATADENEEFERIANALRPGDRLVLHGGTYSQTGRRAVKVAGTAASPIIIEAAPGKVPILTRPAAERDRQNNIEFVDCAHLLVRGLHFRGGSSGVRFIRGQHVTLEDCEISETDNNALTMNSGNCHAFVIRGNHIHHTGLSNQGPTEGEGMYVGCHDGSCRTTDSLFEGNYIHDLRGTSDGGNDGIEIKMGSSGNVVRDNVIHDTNLGRSYPGIFVYGGGPTNNTVEGNVIWNAGEGIQVVSDAVVRNNVIFHCEATGITAAPHAAMRRVRNVRIVHNTIYQSPVGVRLRWAEATDAVLANNAIACPGGTAMEGSPGRATVKRNLILGRAAGVGRDQAAAIEIQDLAKLFVNAAQTNFWPVPGGALVGAADPAFTPKIDFNGTPRSTPSDIGSYESRGQSPNPGWRLRPSYKR